jgi:ABC-2 type transport system permease protein
MTNRTIKVIIAAVLIAVIMCSAVSISQDLLAKVRLDVTDHKLYSLSDGTKAILARLNQPIKMKLYYTRTAAMKGPDQIRFFNNYASFIESLLNEYASQSKGMVRLEVIDPRPFTDEEADAMRYGLRRIPMSQEESFIFGLVVQTQFGVTKTIPLFSPDRQNFVEYDISYLIDTAIRREKKNIGVLSSLPVMGQVSEYMARMMMMQGRRPPGPWTIIEQLRTKYNVKEIESQTDKIEGVDILLVVHPKNLPEQTLFAVDQFVLNGGRLIVFLDPYCYADQPRQQAGMMQADAERGSNLEPLMENWGLKMPDMTFAGDRKLALMAAPNQRPEKIIGFLGLTRADKCFNEDNVISAELNEVRVIFAGALQQTTPPEGNDIHIERTPLMGTTSQGNIWTVDNPYELMMLNPSNLMNKFFDGIEPVHMAYLVSGRFGSAFPDGIKIKNESDPNAEPNLVTGLTVAKEGSQIVIFSDVDFITDDMAYDNTFFGKIALGDNANFVLNAIDSLGGSADLVAVRSRGTFTRNFEIVDQIEAEAEKSVQQQEHAINTEIAAYRRELEKILSSAKQGEEEVIGSSILQKRAELEVKIREAEKRLREVRRNAYQGIERLGDRLRNLNTLPGPVLILLVAVILGIYRGTRKRHYVRAGSDS